MVTVAEIVSEAQNEKSVPRLMRSLFSKGAQLANIKRALSESKISFREPWFKRLQRGYEYLIAEKPIVSNEFIIYAIEAQLPVPDMIEMFLAITSPSLLIAQIQPLLAMHEPNSLTHARLRTLLRCAYSKSTPAVGPHSVSAAHAVAAEPASASPPKATEHVAAPALPKLINPSLASSAPPPYYGGDMGGAGANQEKGLPHSDDFSLFFAAPAPSGNTSSPAPLAAATTPPGGYAVTTPQQPHSAPPLEAPSGGAALLPQGPGVLSLESGDSELAGKNAAEPTGEEMV